VLATPYGELYAIDQGRSLCVIDQWGHGGGIGYCVDLATAKAYGAGATSPLRTFDPQPGSFFGTLAPLGGSYAAS
jgi:hypothetical protein